ncbi:MAG: GFA family protein [Rhizobiaceae bacterium]
MPQDVERSGGCLCGAVRFVVRGKPLRVGRCHCQDCRRTSGSAFSFFAVWPRSALTGKGRLSSFDGRSFCRKCGSRVVHLREDEAELMVGSFDAVPSDLTLDYELWIVRRENWLDAHPGAVQYPRDREEP